MNDKQEQLINYLLKTKDWTTSSNIAENIGMSIRTVKNYVNDLNSAHNNLIKSGQNGYLINVPMAINILNSKQTYNNVPQTNKERSIYLITKLLRETEKINVYDFLDEIYISFSTYKNVIKLVKNTLDEYDLVLKQEGDYISIDGSEEEKKRLLINTVLYESSTDYFDLNTIQAVFTNIDTDYTINTLNETLWDNQYFISDLAITSIVLHIIIAIDRSIKKPNDNEHLFEIPDFVPTKIYNMVISMVSKFEDYYNVKLSNDDVMEIVMLLNSRSSSNEIKEMDEKSLDKYLGKEDKKIINELFKVLKENYNIEIQDPQSRVFFAIHIKNLLIRSKSSNFSRNPLTQSVKVRTPLIYDAAVSLSQVIADYSKVVLPDDEIAYLAFHIGTSMESQLNYNNKISTVIYCPTYYNYEHNLTEEIKNHFSKDIIVKNVITGRISQKDLKGVELLISTKPFIESGDVKTVNISMFLNVMDVGMIEKAILQINSEKKSQEFINNMHTLTKKEFYKHLNKDMTKVELLTKMCNELVEAGYANDTFLKDVLEREKLSSTHYENCAIPHTIRMRQKKSCISICILDTPIIWNKHETNLVIMLCLTPSDKEIFYNLFETLSTLLTNKGFVQKLLETKTYEEMCELIINYREYTELF